MSRRYVMAVLLSPALALALGTFAWSDSSPAGPLVTSGQSQPHLVRPDAARIYLAQALASLGRAEQLVQQASQYGDLGTLDVERFLSDLQAISGDLQRFVIQDSPQPGLHLPVEITGQYLYDGLSRRRQPTGPSARPHKESRP